MGILEALSDEERSLLVDALHTGAPDLLIDVENGLVTPGPRERIVDILEERQIGDLLRTGMQSSSVDAMERLIRRLDEIHPREAEMLVHHGRSDPGTRVPRGMERYREKNPEYGTPQIWDVAREQWVPARSRATWAAPSYALRPKTSTTFRIDLTYKPDASGLPLRPGSKYQAILPGGAEADYFTDSDGSVCFVETEYGTALRSNPALDTALTLRCRPMWSSPTTGHVWPR